MHQKLLTYARQHSVKDAARAFGCFRNTVRKWLRRYQPGQPSSMAEHSRHPQHCPHQTPPSVAGVVVRLQCQTDFGAERLKFECRLPCSVSAIHRLLRAADLVPVRTKNHFRKKQLRAWKKTGPLFGQLVADTKVLAGHPGLLAADDPALLAPASSTLCTRRSAA